MGPSSDQETVEERLRSEKTLVLKQADAEVDVVVSVALLSGFALDKTLRLQGKEFGLDCGVVGRERAKVRECDQAFVLATAEHEPTGAVRQKADTDAEDGAWDELETERKTPRSVALPGVLCATDVVLGTSDTTDYVIKNALSISTPADRPRALTVPYAIQ